LEEILESIQKAKVRLGANVNFDLTMELLFTTIKENFA
jgi:DNA polymerase-3 subunit delta'